MTSTKEDSRIRKSEILTDGERAEFDAWVGSYPTKTDAKEALGVTINTLDRLLLKGSASPETITKVRQALAARKNSH